MSARRGRAPCYQVASLCARTSSAPPDRLGRVPRGIERPLSLRPFSGAATSAPQNIAKAAGAGAPSRRRSAARALRPRPPRADDRRKPCRQARALATPCWPPTRVVRLARGAGEHRERSPSTAGDIRAVPVAVARWPAEDITSAARARCRVTAARSPAPRDAHATLPRCRRCCRFAARSAEAAGRGRAARAPGGHVSASSAAGEDPAAGIARRPLVAPAALLGVTSFEPHALPQRCGHRARRRPTTCSSSGAGRRASTSEASSSSRSDAPTTARPVHALAWADVESWAARRAVRHPAHRTSSRALVLSGASALDRAGSRPGASTVDCPRRLRPYPGPEAPRSVGRRPPAARSTATARPGATCSTAPGCSAATRRRRRPARLAARGRHRRLDGDDRPERLERGRRQRRFVHRRRSAGTARTSACRAAAR